MEEEPELWEPLVKYMELHPSYYQGFQETTELMFYGDGPLPLPYRHFIAIMGASRYHCEYLVDIHSCEFRRLGGEPGWLSGGLSRVPNKLQKLDVINRIMAHQPWILTVDHLHKLTRCPSPDNWSLSELIQGVVILAHVHSLCSFVAGCGIISSQPPSPQAAPAASPAPTPPSNNNPAVSESGGGDGGGGGNGQIIIPNPTTNKSEITLLMARMKEMQERESSTSLLTDNNGTVTSTTNSPVDDEKAQTFAQVLLSLEESQQHQHNLQKSSNTSTSVPSTTPKTQQQQKQQQQAHDPRATTDHTTSTNNHTGDTATTTTTTAGGSKNGGSVNQNHESSSGCYYTKDVNTFQYVDFVKRENAPMYPTFKIHDYSWEDQGFSLVSQLYSNISDPLDHKFRLTKTLTYNTMGAFEEVDTSKYRMAIWNYIQSLYGIRHDDYDYIEVNQLLSRPMKELIKVVTCFPDRTTASQRRNGLIEDFTHSEKVHVMLMLLEARQQSELLYLLRAVMRFMSQS